MGYAVVQCHWVFHWLNPSDHTMALGSTQSLAEMRNRNISWGVKGWRPYHIHVLVV